MTIIFVIIFILLAAFFAGSEIAYTTLDVVKLRTMSAEKNRKAAKLVKLHSQPEKLINIMLIGTNISIITATAIMTLFIKQKFNINATIITTIIMTTIILLFSELIPKAIFKTYSLRISLFLIEIWNLLSYIFLPVLFILEKMLRLVMSVTGLSKTDKKPLLTKKGLIEYLQETIAPGSLSKRYRTTFEKIAHFSNITVKEIMTPYIEIVSIEKNRYVRDIIKLLHKTGFKKIAVYKNSPDNIIGYINSYDLINYPPGEPVSRFIKTPVFIPETKKVSELFFEFNKLKSEFILVIDEYGSVAGLITPVDIMEKIMGEIEFLTKEKRNIIKKLGKNHFHVDAGIEIDEFNSFFKTTLPKYDYNTLTGFIEHYLERIPEKNEEFTLKNIKFKIVKSNARTIKSIMVKLK